MILLTGTKAECIKEMLRLEELHGRQFWVTSLDDTDGTYQLEASESFEPTRTLSLETER
jgi:hypothetical protein